jgi:putative membrane protein insertion efficiency factor
MKSAALALIRFYRICLSPLLPSFCRFYPTCSVYAYEAIERYGAWRGTGMALRRVLRCRPGGGFGCDPVPEEQVSGVGCQVSGGA